jgi:xanthine/CO dehydrogenase XdhC/CoxF family maturation factor/CTP:molybdopterin cytidylyltransferase MocA
MDGSLHQLLPFYRRARAAGVPLVFATVVATRGSTYRKAGAQMLIGPGGRYEGIVSGGCLEGDLAAHAASVLETGAPKMVQYNNGGDDDLLWGLGAGCEGGMDIWLQRLDPAANWEPFETLARCFEQGEPSRYALVLESADPGLPLGTAPGTRVFEGSVAAPHQLLLIGGGPDALPLVEFGAALGWRITVADHRPAYADVARFPRAQRVLQSTPGDLSPRVDLAKFDAAVVMSHHLATDRAALEVLAGTSIPYVGLLGPASRRQRLLSDLGPAIAAKFGARLHAPVGLELGGRDPAGIALAIAAEIQAHLHGKGRRQALERNTAASSLHVMLLAAGSSSRFGAPKQLADIAGQPMLARTLDAVSQLERRHPVTVVLGAHAELLAPLVHAASARVAINPDYAQGMAGSIRAGLAQAPRDARGVLIALADQVAVTADDLRALVAGWEPRPDRIVAAEYAGTLGAPVVFPVDLFDELAQLQGDRGARTLLSRHPGRVVGVPMPSAALDIDTPADIPRKVQSR